MRPLDTNTVPVITAYRKKGLIRFNSVALKKLGLAVKMGVFVGISEEEDSLLITADHKGIAHILHSLRTDRITPTLQASYKDVAVRLCDIAEADNYCKFLISTTPQKAGGRDWFRIITTRPIDTK